MERMLLTPKEAADELRISRSQVYVMLKRGELPSVRVANLIRVPADALRALIARLTQDTRDAA